MVAVKVRVEQDSKVVTACHLFSHIVTTAKDSRIRNMIHTGNNSTVQYNYEA